MRYDEMLPEAPLNVEHQLGEMKIQKQEFPQPCVICQPDSFWVETTSGGAPLCGLVCQQELKKRIVEQNTKLIMNAHVQVHREAIMQELQYCETCDDRSKDILVVVHNQYDYVKLCLESVMSRTKNYKLYLWDNNSDDETATYLKTLAEAHPDTIYLARSEKNLGFIQPNNMMVGWGSGDYVILLNSDTQVFTGWDLGMLGYLQNHHDVAQVGFLGGMLLEDGRGEGGEFGDNVDYIAGFCSCMSRETYRKFGLFDDEYKFAYFEDSDLSLRLKAAGYKIHALHLMLCHHYQNQTVKAVKKANQIDLAATFQANQLTFQRRWADYLKTGRIKAISAAN